MPEPTECAICHTSVTMHRMALTIDGVVVAVVPVCKAHARSILTGNWALQVEPEWGGPWIQGSEHRR